MNCSDALVAQTVKTPPAVQEAAGSIPGSGKTPGGGNGSPLQYPRLENPTDRGAGTESDVTEATNIYLLGL